MENEDDKTQPEELLSDKLLSLDLEDEIELDDLPL